MSQYIIGTTVDISHIGKQTSVILKKNDRPMAIQNTYDYIFKLVDGHIKSYRPIRVVFA